MFCLADTDCVGCLLSSADILDPCLSPNKGRNLSGLVLIWQRIIYWLAYFRNKNRLEGTARWAGQLLASPKGLGPFPYDFC